MAYMLLFRAQRQAAKAKPDPKVAKEDNGAGQPGTASPARDRGQRAEGGSKVPTARPGKRLSSKDSESGTQSSHRMSGDASLASETQSDATSSATADSISREGPPRPPARPREFKQRPDPEADKRGSSTSISAGSGERERREAGDDDGPPEVAPPSRHQAPPPSSTRPAQAGKVRAPGDAIEEAREAVAVKPPARAANEGQGDPAGSKGKQAGPDARPAKTSSESRPRSKTTRAPLARDYSRTMGNPAKMTHLAAPFSATLDMEAPVVAHGSFPAQNRAPEGFGFVGTAGAGRPFPGETPVGHPHAMFHHGGPGGPQTASPWAAHPTQGAAHQDGCHPVTPVGPGSAAGALGAVAGPAVGGLGAVGGAAVGSAWPGRVAPQLAQVTQGGGAVFGQRASERQAIRAAAAAEKMRSGELAEAEVRDYAVAQKDYAIRAVAPDGGQGGKDEGGWRGGANEGEEAYEGDIRRSGAVVVAREVQGRNPAYAQLPSDRRIVAWLREYE